LHPPAQAYTDGQGSNRGKLVPRRRRQHTLSAAARSLSSARASDGRQDPEPQNLPLLRMCVLRSMPFAKVRTKRRSLPSC